MTEKCPTVWSIIKAALKERERGQTSILGREVERKQEQGRKGSKRERHCEGKTRNNVNKIEREKEGKRVIEIEKENESKIIKQLKQ